MLSLNIAENFQRFPTRILVDESNPGYKFVGQTCHPSAKLGDQVWQIYAERTIAAGLIERIYAEESTDFRFAWNDRAAYFGTSEVFLNARSALFDGVNDYAAGPTGIWDEDQSKPFSVSFWARAGSLSGTQVVLSNYSAAVVKGKFIHFASGQLEAYIYNAGSNYVAVRTGVVATIATWSHYVVTYDGSSTVTGFKAYVNGVLTPTSQISNSLTGSCVSGAIIAVGALVSPPAQRFFNGYLDEISVWDKVLSQSEVSELFHGAKPADLNVHSASANLKHWWRMGDGVIDSFPIIGDAIGGANLSMINMLANQITMEVP